MWEKWNQIKEVYGKTAKGTDKTWPSTDTVSRIEERKAIKSKRTQERLQLEYRIKDQANANIGKDKVRNPLIIEETQAKRWVEHFSEVLSREAAIITADPTPHDDLDIATGAISIQEIT